MTGTFGSVRETLMHLFAAEEGYVRHFTGISPTPPLKELPTFPGFDELRRRAEWSGKELITIAEQRDLSQIFYLDGGTYEAPAIVVVIQAINHAIDHRSQIATSSQSSSTLRKASTTVGSYWLPEHRCSSALATVEEIGSR